MVHSDRYEILAQLYFDNELTGRELEDFREHLPGCAHCQDYLIREREFSDVLRQTRPLFAAPEELRRRVTDEITKQPRFVAKTSPDPFCERILQWLRRVARRIEPSALRWRAVAVTGVFVAVVLTLMPIATWRVAAASYADAALETHRSYLAGNLPPEILSSSPEAITAWFAGKLPFVFRLPASQLSHEGQQIYRLTGGRLVKYNNSYAALVVYEMETSKISLMIISEKSAGTAGGDEVRSGGITFHYHVKNGFNIITWSNHGLAYALVSSVQGSARSSCLVCHQDMVDQNDFKEAQ